MSQMFSRAGRAALLDRKPFTEAYFDGDSAADAALIVSFVAAATYLGRLARAGALASFSLTALLQVVIAGVISWLIVGFATWFAATRLFQASGRPQTMIALQGLAALPLLLEIFAGQGGLGQIAGAAALVWYLAVLVVATREAADVTTRNAVVSVLIGLALAALLRILLGVPFAIFSALF